MEFKRLAEEVDGDPEEDDQDPDVMNGTQPGTTLQNVAFRFV